MNNFFLDLYTIFQKMNMNGKDLDHLLNALPWKEERKEDGTIYYTCEVKE
jgi:hypothetical protein